MKFIYFTDPMCSWCYGFGPALRRLVEAYRGKIGLEVVPGGLRAGETKPLSEARTRELLHHWATVREETGVSFAADFFARHPGFIYDTYPACRAVNAAEAASAGAALLYLESLQRHFYAEGRDPKSLETLTAAAVAAGIDAGRFTAAYTSREAELRTAQGFERFQEAGGMGFPMLLLDAGEKPSVVTIGYQPFEHLHCVVENILKRVRPNPLRLAN